MTYLYSLRAFPTIYDTLRIYLSAHTNKQKVIVIMSVILDLHLNRSYLSCATKVLKCSIGLLFYRNVGPKNVYTLTNALGKK